MLMVDVLASTLKACCVSNIAMLATLRSSLVRAINSARSSGAILAFWYTAEMSMLAER